MKKIFFSICMLAAMSSVVLTSCKDEDVAGTPAAITPANPTATNTAVNQTAVNVATAGTIQTPGTTSGTNTAGQTVTTVVAAPTTTATGAQQQVVTETITDATSGNKVGTVETTTTVSENKDEVNEVKVTKDENDNIVNTVETKTTIESKTGGQLGSTATAVSVTKDAAGNQMGEPTTTVTDYTYTYTVAGKTYKTTAELQAALAKLPAGQTVKVVTVLTQTITVNDKEESKKTSTAETEVVIPQENQKIETQLAIPSTIQTEENSEVAAATQNVTFEVAKPAAAAQHNGGGVQRD